MEKINVLINEARIEKRLDEMAKEIERDYKDKTIVFVCILKGAAMFAIELAKRIKNNVELEFIEASSYKGTESTGKITIHNDITQSIEGKEVIIIEDLIDTGRTLEYIKNHLLEMNPASLKIATLLSKPSRRIIELDVDYIGFQIGDDFVIGYCMDYNQNMTAYKGSCSYHTV